MKFDALNLHLLKVTGLSVHTQKVAFLRLALQTQEAGSSSDRYANSLSKARYDRNALNPLTLPHTQPHLELWEMRETAAGAAAATPTTNARWCNL